MDATRVRSEVVKIVYDSLEDMVDTDVSKIDAKTPITEYGMDSIDCMDFLYQVEDKLDLPSKIDPREIGEMLNIENVMNAIERNVRLV